MKLQLVNGSVNFQISKRKGTGPFSIGKFIAGGLNDDEIMVTVDYFNNVDNQITKLSFFFNTNGQPVDEERNSFLVGFGKSTSNSPRYWVAPSIDGFFLVCHVDYGCDQSRNAVKNLKQRPMFVDEQSKWVYAMILMRHSLTETIIEVYGHEMTFVYSVFFPKPKKHRLKIFIGNLQPNHSLAWVNFDVPETNELQPLVEECGSRMMLNGWYRWILGHLYGFHQPISNLSGNYPSLRNYLSNANGANGKYRVEVLEFPDTGLSTKEVFHNDIFHLSTTKFLHWPLNCQSLGTEQFYTAIEERLKQVKCSPYPKMMILESYALNSKIHCDRNFKGPLGDLESSISYSPKIVNQPSKIAEYDP